MAADSDRARLGLELGDPKLALELMEKMTPFFASHPLIGPRCQSGWGGSLAVHQLGGTHEIISELETLEIASLVTRRIMLSNCAFALSLLGEPETARQKWLEYLEFAPDPISYRAYFSLGEIAEALGESEAAQEWFEKVATSGIETYLTAKARGKLEN